jgi:hypothetical protein
MAFELTAFPRPELRSGRIVSPAAAVARARADLAAAEAAEEEALCSGGGPRLLRLSAATERAIRALNRAERVLNSTTRRQ